MTDTLQELLDFGVDLLAAVLGTACLLRGVSIIQQFISAYQILCGG